MEAVALERIRFTRADYDRIPEDLRVELIDGELLKMPSPTVDHQALAGFVYQTLARVLPLRRVFFGPIDFAIDDLNVLVPDVVAIETPAARGSKDLASALLVVEILSPSTAARDRAVKTDLYLEAGVREVWLVDARAKKVELRTKAGLQEFAAGRTAASAAVPGFRLELDELFRA